MGDDEKPNKRTKKAALSNAFPSTTKAAKVKENKASRGLSDDKKADPASANDKQAKWVDKR